MRFSLMCVMAISTCTTLTASSAIAIEVTPEMTRQLIRDVVYNEIHDHDVHGYWHYTVQKCEGTQIVTEEQVETHEGPMHRLITVNGTPLNRAQQSQEEDRLRRLLQDPSEQRQLREKYADDEHRIIRIVQLLPEAFLYDYQGQEGDNFRFAFRPNPGFRPPTIEARVFHAMGGTIWIDGRHKHLARLQGRLIDDVVFGFGFFGRLNKGGWFNMERVQVSETDWKTHLLEVEMSGKAIFFKTISKNTHETRTGFEPVARATTIAEAKNLLDLDVLHYESAAMQKQSERSASSSR